MPSFEACVFLLDRLEMEAFEVDTLGLSSSPAKTEQ